MSSCGVVNETILHKSSVSCKRSHTEIASKQNPKDEEAIYEPCGRTAFQLRTVVSTRNFENMRYSRKAVT